MAVLLGEQRGHSILPESAHTTARREPVPSPPPGPSPPWRRPVCAPSGTFVSLGWFNCGISHLRGRPDPRLGPYSPHFFATSALSTATSSDGCACVQRDPEGTAPRDVVHRVEEGLLMIGLRIAS